MDKKPTSEELENRIQELEQAILYFQKDNACSREKRERELRVLRSNEIKFKALLNASTELAALVGLDGTVIMANEVAAQRLGKRLGQEK